MGVPFMASVKDLRNRSVSAPLGRTTPRPVPYRTRILTASQGTDKSSSLRKDVRFVGVDVLRGLAIVMMLAYHFCYDLAYFGFASWRPIDMLTDWGWIAWRNFIVASFLVLVGLSRALNVVFKPSSSDFWMRWTQIAVGAALVSLASYEFAGERWIYFGILHFIAVAVLFYRLVLPRAKSALWIAVVGSLALGAGLLFSTPALDPTPLNILGFVAHKPPTEDFVPLFPWIGVVFIGLAGGLFWRSHDFAPVPTLTRLRAVVPVPVQQALAAAGRWSLSIYLVHQVVLMGVFAVVASLARSHTHLP